ncbi:MAG: hypothetical protein U1E05_24725, partial [Patescibacteria group bacterium]|nr:hypothetical protein [Patescibacteria group bacterium]
MQRASLNTILATTLMAILAGLPAAETPAAETLALQTCRRGVDAETGKPRVDYRSVEWEGAKTAVIVCDMWAKHWCAGATGRVEQMAPRMNAFIAEARRRGALVIHAPSGGMAHYEDHPARRR